MFKVEVEASDFIGLNMVKQHKLVTGILSEHIANMHGITIKTRRPSAE
jgi:stress-induced morphogen